MTRTARLCAVLAVGIVVVASAAVYALKASQKMPDFEVYWRAGLRAAHAEPLYTLDDGHYQLKYLPAFAMIAVPLAWLPLDVAKAVWFALSIGVLGGFVAMSIGLLPERRKRLPVLVTLVVLAMAKFYGHELVLGQVNLLLGATVVAAVHLLMKDHQVPAGLLLALAVVIKPYAVIFVPWLAAIGRWRALVWTGAGLVGASLLPVTVYGASATWTLHREWWRTVSASTGPNLLNADNVSLAAMFAKWLGPGEAASWLALLSSAALLAAAADVIRRRRTVRAPLGLEAALLLTLMPLLSPQGWDYVFLLATPAVAFLVNDGDRLPRPVGIAAALALAIVAFSLFDIMGRRAYATFMSLSIVTVCFLVVIGALYALRVRRFA